jgi:uncharacterized protein (DUF433 family)
MCGGLATHARLYLLVSELGSLGFKESAESSSRLRWKRRCWELAGNLCAAYPARMLTATEMPHIRLDEAGRAWIDATNVKVIEVVLDHLAYSWTPEEMHLQHPNLSIAQLYAAMAYYHEHRPEMDAEIARGLSRADERRTEAEATALRRSDLEARLARE